MVRGVHIAPRERTAPSHSRSADCSSAIDQLSFFLSLSPLVWLFVFLAFLSRNIPVMRLLAGCAAIRYSQCSSDIEDIDERSDAGILRRRKGEGGIARASDLGSRTFSSRAALEMHAKYHIDVCARRACRVIGRRKLTSRTTRTKCRAN